MKEPIYIGKSRFGKGVFASCDIKKGEVIYKLKGKRVGIIGLLLEHSRGRNALIDSLQIGNGKYIVLDKKCLMTNHSCNPNSGIKGLKLIAIGNIKKDEEILFDYSITWDEGLDCKCGNKNCRGKIADFLFLPKKIQKRYIDLGIVPRYIQKKADKLWKIRKNC